MKTLNDWKDFIGAPKNYKFDKSLKLIKKYNCSEFDCELYMQANGVRQNGEITYQRLMMVLPKNFRGKLPAVAVPFYYPEAAMGFDPETQMPVPIYEENPTVIDIVKRGYIAASAESYHLTYTDYDKNASDISGSDRWCRAAMLLAEEQPYWSGIGKLISDTRLLIDALCDDARVDENRIGIAGHSLGGKMAFYTGCLDERVKVIVASDFGFGWDQTNWSDPWYWGDKLQVLKDSGMDNADLLSCVAPKPFCLLAGKYDNDDSRKMLYSIKEYNECPGNILIVDHRSGHKPPKYAADAGYGFLDNWLK